MPAENKILEKKSSSFEGTKKVSKKQSWTTSFVERYKSNSTSGSFLSNFWQFVVANSWIKVVLFVVFLGLSTGSVFLATGLQVRFAVTDLLSDDSYVKAYFDAFKTYNERPSLYTSIFFRNENFSDPNVREQMKTFIDDLTTLEQFEKPSNFWLYDFEEFVAIQNLDQAGLTFEEQLQLFMSQDLYNLLYGSSILRDESGNMLASTIGWIPIKDLPIDDATQQLDFFLAQRDVSGKQAINEGKSIKELSFFTYGGDYKIFAFFEFVTIELIMTVVFTFVAVAVITLCFVPHPSSVFFVLISTAMIFADVLGVMKLTGLAINPVTVSLITFSTFRLTYRSLSLTYHCAGYSTLQLS